MSQPTNFELNDKRIINAWCMFDWANSAYALVIAVAIFPIYFNAVMPDNFTLLGIEMTDSSLFSYSISLAYIVIASLSPILSGISDYSGRKKFFMRLFTTLGAVSCMALFFFTEDTKPLGVIGFILATIGFAGSQVFYNAYLPEIVSEDQYDRVSARGFTFGYVGSVLLLIFNLVMYMKPTWFGFAEGSPYPARIAFLLVGIWWIGWSQITFLRLPKDAKKSAQGLLTKGYEELKKVWGELRTLRNTKRFLFAYFFFIAGAQTVIFLATTFAIEELNFETAELITTILLLQFVGIVGAFLFAKLSDLKGNKISLMSILVIWISVCIAAYFVTEKGQFYGVAAVVGLVMGGIQSMSRSTYSKLIPMNTTDTASYFSFYDVVEKYAIVIGTFSFGFIEVLTGGMRNSILALITFFALGIVILATVKIQRGVKA